MLIISSVDRQSLQLLISFANQNTVWNIAMPTTPRNTILKQDIIDTILSQGKVAKQSHLRRRIKRRHYNKQYNLSQLTVLSPISSSCAESLSSSSVPVDTFDMVLYVYIKYSRANARDVSDSSSSPPACHKDTRHTYRRYCYISIQIPVLQIRGVHIIIS